MLTALRRLFKPHKKLPDCELAPEDGEKSGERQDGFEERERLSWASQKLKRWTSFFGRGDGARRSRDNSSASRDSEVGRQPLTTFGQPTTDSLEENSRSSGSGARMGRLCGNEFSNTASGTSSCTDSSCCSRRTRGDCSRSSCSSNCSSRTCTSFNSVCKASNCAAEVNADLHEKSLSKMGDGDKREDQEHEITRPAMDNTEEEDADDNDDEDVEEGYKEDLEDGPVAFIAEAPPKQQQQSQNLRLQQQKQQRPSDRMSAMSVTVGELAKKATKQPTTYSQSKTDVDQLLTGSASQQQRKDIVRGNLEELRVAESVNFRSVVYKYSFRIPENFVTMRIFTDPDDRRIEAIARSCGTQIRLERARHNVNSLARTRTVTIQAPDLHSLEKCCRQFDDRFPQFYVSGGLGQSSKSIKRVYVDELDSPS